MEKRFVYADNAATTRISRTVLDAMMPALTGDFGNPSAVYRLGRDAAGTVLAARKQCADALGTKVSEVYFTSGGSESDNWAIKGAAALGMTNGKRHIVTSAVEHHAVLNSCAALEKNGFEVTYLMPDKYGRITAEQVAAAVREDTCLVSLMTANNEVGTLMPVAETAAVCRERGVLFHTDAVQAVGHIPINVRELGVDMLSLSGHKIHAPKGIGILYVRSGVELPNFIDGGGQERGRRGGTENVPAIIGLGQALTEAVADITARNARIAALRDRLAEGLLAIPRTHLNGHPTERLAGNLSLSFEGIEGESLLLMLDMRGICASSGSACSAGSTEPSHVLTAMGLTEQLAKGSLRLSLGDDTTDEDVDYMLDVIPECVSRLREMSPLWQNIIHSDR